MTCQCGHDAQDHIELPGFPGGAQECQVGRCGCASFRPGGVALLRKPRGWR